jgi:hypothetical protein
MREQPSSTAPLARSGAAHGSGCGAATNRSALYSCRRGVDWTDKVTRRFCESASRTATVGPRPRRPHGQLRLSSREPFLEDSRSDSPVGQSEALKEVPIGSEVASRAAGVAGRRSDPRGGAGERHSAALRGPDVGHEHAVADRESPFDCANALASLAPLARIRKPELMSGPSSAEFEVVNERSPRGSKHFRGAGGATARSASGSPPRSADRSPEALKEVPMVLKSPAEPLGSLADGVIPGVAQANGTRPRSGARCWPRARSRGPRIPV